MKRDMELIRKILFTIEDQYKDRFIRNLHIDGYDMKTVAYHCKLLYEAGLIEEYRPIEADQGLLGFLVESLTWNGHDFIDNIRSDTVWKNTKEVIIKKGLPMVLNVVKDIAISITTEMTQAAIKGMIN